MRVHRERPRGIGGRRQDIGQRRDPDDVRRVAAAGAFGVIGVDRAAADGRDGVLDESGFVDRVGVDGHLDVEFVGDRQARSRSRREWCPSLRAASGRRRPRRSVRRSGSRRRRVSLAEKAEIHGPRFGGLQACGARFQAPGVHVVASVPVAGPVPPPIMVVMPLESAS